MNRIEQEFSKCTSKYSRDELARYRACDAQGDRLRGSVIWSLFYDAMHGYGKRSQPKANAAIKTVLNRMAIALGRTIYLSKDCYGGGPGSVSLQFDGSTYDYGNGERGTNDKQAEVTLQLSDGGGEWDSGYHAYMPSDHEFAHENDDKNLSIRYKCTVATSKLSREEALGLFTHDDFYAITLAMDADYAASEAMLAKANEQHSFTDGDVLVCNGSHEAFLYYDETFYCIAPSGYTKCVVKSPRHYPEFIKWLALRMKTKKPVLVTSGIKIVRSITRCDVTGEIDDWEPIVSVGIWADIFRSIADAQMDQNNA